ncbi:hypothetical protein KW805_02440 [Candidatus Pacearchaeota archaeon]|nr:hypothetical protein [Candidatus Pacearchaeota archaeon]
MQIVGDKRGQLAIIIIIALVIVAGVIVYFVVRGTTSISSVSPELKPVYDAYEACIRSDAEAAISLAGSQGGRINVGPFIPGSDYAPSSSHLNFLGFPVPYWYYVSGNGVIKESIPTKASMQNEIADSIERSLDDCNFEQYYSQGYSIGRGSTQAKVTVDDIDVVVTVDSPLEVSKGDKSARVTSHQVVISSKLGKFYKMAREIYQKEKQESFLENYSADVLRLYAPVDGVEISCSGKVWKTPEVVSGLKEGLANNVNSLRLKGNYYSLSDKKREYFVVDKSVDEAVSFMYNPSWPSKVEITGNGVGDSLMIADPVGNEQGLGVMGFCYSPYHFVYDVSFPVMVQIYNNEEVFQFPVAVVLDKNLPRRGAFSEISESPDVDVCQYSTQPLKVSVYDSQLAPINANISYRCFDQRCNLGSTSNGVFQGNAPACVNGYLDVSSSGYASHAQLLSTNEESSADVILDREYDVSVSLQVDGKPLDGSAIVSFIGPSNASSALPGSDTLKLSEGTYEVRAYVYGNSSITIPSSTKSECTDVPQTGISGFFGGTKEQCYTITLPETKIDYALVGGGVQSSYILGSDLSKGNIVLNVHALPRPNSLEQLQYNYESFESSGIDISYEH